MPVEELIKLGLEAAACILVSEDMARGSSADEPIDAGSGVWRNPRPIAFARYCRGLKRAAVSRS
jgi:hypothetical protein